MGVRLILGIGTVAALVFVAFPQAQAKTFQDIKNEMRQQCQDTHDAVCAGGYVIDAIELVSGGGSANNACQGGLIVDNVCMIMAPSDKSCNELCSGQSRLSISLSVQQCQNYAKARNFQFANFEGNGNFPKGCALYTDRNEVLYSQNGNTKAKYPAVCTCQ